MRRLSNVEYEATIRSLFSNTQLGDAGSYAAAFPSDTVVNGFTNNTDVQDVGPALGEQYLLVAESISTKAVKNVDALLGCALASGDTCISSFITRFGKRAWRRPLNSTEQTQLLTVFRNGRTSFDATTGVRLLLQAMLASPNFLYRVEVGAPVSGQPYAALTSWEMASRLSYFLTGTMPDDALLAAAEADSLKTPEGIATQARRLLKTPAARVQVADFFSGWLNLRALDHLQRNTKEYPNWNSQLPQLFFNETRTFATRVIFDGAGDLNTLLTAPFTYGDPSLAAYYGGTAGPVETDGLPSTPTVVYALNAGGGQYIGKDGITYAADANFQAGGAYTTTNVISGTEDGPLYQSERYNTGMLNYNIPMANGIYDVTLKFAEIYQTTVGKRIFGISIENTTVMQALDLVSAAGAFTAHDRKYPGIEVKDGMLNISITATTGTADNPKLSGLVVYSRGANIARIDLPPTQRAGILTQASFLATHAKEIETDPVARGKFVRERLLCQGIPAPPPELNISAPVIVPGSTTRQRFAQHQSQPVCAVCHIMIDPVGLPFEHYDSTGQWRDTEHGATIDATGDLTKTDVTGFLDGIVDMAEKLASSEQVSECFVRYWFRFTFGRGEIDTDDPLIEAVTRSFMTDEQRVQELLIALTTTPEFRYLAKETTQ